MEKKVDIYVLMRILKEGQEIKEKVGTVVYKKNSYLSPT